MLKYVGEELYIKFILRQYSFLIGYKSIFS